MDKITRGVGGGVYVKSFPSELLFNEMHFCVQKRKRFNFISIINEDLKK